VALILIVEDNPTNRMLAHVIVERAGHEPLATDNVFEALRLAHRHIPALILMDIRLPGLDGIEATRRLKRRPSTRDIPIIAVTAQAMPGDESRIRAGGCDGYLRKPYRPAQLLDMIAAFLPPMAGLPAH